MKLLLLLLLPCFCFGQKKHLPVSEDSMINKWQSAVVNIETITSASEQPEIITKLYTTVTSRASRDSVYKFLSDTAKQDETGTAIYLIDKGRHFLITARHVVYDNLSSDSNRIRRTILLIANQSDEVTHRTHNSITSPEWASLTWFNEGMFKSYSKLSSFQEDLGIICLDSLSGGSNGQLFINTLKYRGYQPITPSDIDNVCNITANQDICTIGYPAFDWIRFQNKDFFGQGITPPIKTIPQFTKGVIESVNKKDYFFLANMLTYFGNSGGPVISGNKLIGIVSGIKADTISTGNHKLKYIYKTYGVMIKASLILPILRKLEAELPK